MSKYRFNTRAIHQGIDDSNSGNPTQQSIVQSAAFSFQDAEDLENTFKGRQFGYLYSRISNPSVNSFEQKINSLEDGIGAAATASGMAAITSVFQALVKTGSIIHVSRSLFSGTLSLIHSLFEKYNITVKYFSIDNIDNLDKDISDASAFVFAESIGNPKLDIPDFDAISAICKKHTIPFIVDSTFTSPYLFKAKDFGVDVVVHSSTKYLTGNGSTIGGVLIDTGNFNWQKADGLNQNIKVHPDFLFLANIRKEILQNTGALMSPFNAYISSLGIETLSLRIDRHSHNAAALSDFFTSHNKIINVNYPGLTDNPYNKHVQKYFNRMASGVLTISLKSKADCYTMIKKLKLIKTLSNIGDAKTLIIHPASTIYADTDAQQTADAGVDDCTLRISTGLEDIDDIIEDFSQALKEI
jgi:O-acetylhomoserine (thiol)-lyase